MFSLCFPYFILSKKSRILNGTKLDKILPPTTCLESQCGICGSRKFFSISKGLTVKGVAATPGCSLNPVFSNGPYRVTPHLTYPERLSSKSVS